MKRLEASPGSSSSMRCSSSLVPRVTVTSAWVSPRVNSAEPCVRGRTPVSMVMARISSKARPSGRRRFLSISSRKMRSLRASKQSAAAFWLSSGWASTTRLRSAAARAWLSSFSYFWVLRASVSSARTSFSICAYSSLSSGGGVNSRLVLPASFMSSRMAAAIFLQQSWPILDGAQHLGFGGLLRPGFHHDDAVFGARHHDVELAFAAFAIGGIGDVLPVFEPYADAAQHVRERNIGDGQRRRRAGDGQRIGVLLRIGREHHGDDLGFVEEAFGEERPDRPVDQAAGKNLFFRGTSLAFDEAAGNFSGGVSVFPIVHGEREKARCPLWAARPCMR